MQHYGLMSGSVVGIVMKEVVRRAMGIAKKHIATIEVHEKEGYRGGAKDVFTKADKDAQIMYERLLHECFPEFGIIGEEDTRPEDHDRDIDISDNPVTYFTVDPIDGTKAYIRRQSHGIGSMVAFVDEGVVAAAYIGDIMTGEIYGYRPESSSVWRIRSMEMPDRLDVDPHPRDLGQMHILLREREADYQDISRAAIDAASSLSIDGGSIGIWAARLWKREVGALFLPPSIQTPWDETPVVGISRKLGYVFLRAEEDRWVEYEPTPSREITERSHDLLIIHANDLDFLSKRFRVERKGW